MAKVRLKVQQKEYNKKFLEKGYLCDKTPVGNLLIYLTSLGVIVKSKRVSTIYTDGDIYSIVVKNKCSKKDLKENILKSFAVNIDLNKGFEILEIK